MIAVFPLFGMDLGPVGLLALLVVMVTAVVSVRIAMAKGYSQVGFSLFALVVPIFPLVCAIAFPEKESKRVEVTNFPSQDAGTGPRTNMVACYWCAEQIQAAARICRHCGRESQAQAGSAATPARGVTESGTDATAASGPPPNRGWSTSP